MGLQISRQCFCTVVECLTRPRVVRQRVLSGDVQCNITIPLSLLLWHTVILDCSVANMAFAVKQQTRHATA